VKVILTKAGKVLMILCFNCYRSLLSASAPGSKIIISSGVSIIDGYFVMTSSNAKVVGGKVKELVEAWEVKMKKEGFLFFRKKPRLLSFDLNYYLLMVSCQQLSVPMHQNLFHF
jgi:hypothetical protein